ncbi:MAG: trigger factor [Patescibacteria group bacterium]
MPTSKTTLLPKAQVQISFEVPWEEALPYLEEAAKDISKAKPLPGFRPGHATYEDVKRAHGEMAILETAIERIVRSAYVKTVLAEKLNTVGSPSITMDALTPGQTIKFTTVVSIVPTITKLASYDACKVKKNKTEVNEAQVEEAIDQMRKMRAEDIKVERAATLEDMVMIDMEMVHNNVTLEGGKGADYRVYLNEPHYIPGMTEQLVGVKEGDEKTFVLPFPENHYQKHLAGKDITFVTKTKGVFERKMPTANDEFAKAYGLEGIADLRSKLKENLINETESRAAEAAEIEMLEKLVDASTFGDVPDVLINEEVNRMMKELEHGIEEQGMTMENYLSSIKKTKDDLKLDFIKQAIRRINTAILIKEVSVKEKLEVTEEEIDAEIDTILDQVPADDAATRERVTSPDYREYVSIQMRNRKAIEFLKAKCIEA